MGKQMQIGCQMALAPGEGLRTGLEFQNHGTTIGCSMNLAFGNQKMLNNQNAKTFEALNVVRAPKPPKWAALMTSSN